MEDWDFYGSDYDGLFTIEFTYMDVCNYSCSYCCTKRYRADKVYDLKPEVYIPALNNFLDRLPSKSNFIIMANGEPTLHPLTPHITRDIAVHDNVKNLVLITNLSESLDYYDDLYKNSNEKLYINASYHLEFSDPDDFIDKSKSLCGYNYAVILMAHPERFDEVVDFYDRFKKEVPSSRIYVRLLDDVVYTKEQQDWCRDKGSYVYFMYKGEKRSIVDVRNQGLDVFTGWLCKDAYKNLRINKFGEIMWTEDTKVKFGNIFMNNFDVKDFDVICNLKKCKCLSHLRTPKINIRKN